MFKKFILGVSFAVFANLTNAQIILLNKAGQTTECEEFRITNEGVRVKTKEKKKIIVDPAELLSASLIKGEQTFYFKPINEDSKYDAIPRIIEGKINVYEKTTTIRTPYGSASSSDYFLEKDGVYKFTYTTELIRDRKESLQILKSFVSDNLLIAERLDSENFKLNTESLLEIVMVYNLSAFTKGSEKNIKKSTVFFYSKMKKSTNEDLKLIVNDSLEYVIPAKRTIAVSIPFSHLSKICIKSSLQSECKLISSSPHYIMYYEVDFNLNKNKIELNNIHSKDAQKYIQFINSQGK
ncbi:MAG: hypothetical protein ACK5RG_09055 [Cyclobacteriaceae bacterium]|jgi:hypothetical protein